MLTDKQRRDIPLLGPLGVELSDIAPVMTTGFDGGGRVPLYTPPRPSPAPPRSVYREPGPGNWTGIELEGAELLHPWLKGK